MPAVPGDLNLILHGMFIIVQQPQEIRIVIPATNEHKYQLGSLDKPVPYDPGKLEIRGLSDSPVHQRFERNLNVMLDRIVVKEGDARNVLKLPPPRQIHARRVLARPGNLHFTPFDSVVSAMAFSLVDVLVYPFTDLSKVEVWVTPPKPDPIRLWQGINDHYDPKTGTINLHLFATAPHSGVGHTSEAFDDLMKLIPFPMELHLVVDSDVNPRPEDHTGINGVNTADLDEGPQVVRPDDCLKVVVNNM